MNEKTLIYLLVYDFLTFFIIYNFCMTFFLSFFLHFIVAFVMWFDFLLTALLSCSWHRLSWTYLNHILWQFLYLNIPITITTIKIWIFSIPWRFCPLGIPQYPITNHFFFSYYWLADTFLIYINEIILYMLLFFFSFQDSQLSLQIKHPLSLPNLTF